MVKWMDIYIRIYNWRYYFFLAYSFLILFNIVLYMVLMLHGNSSLMMFPEKNVEVFYKKKVMVVELKGVTSGDVSVLERMTQLSSWSVLLLGEDPSHDEIVYDIAQHPNVVYLSDKDQRELVEYRTLSSHKNRMRRKNIGYLFAIERGAEVIFDVDPHTSFFSIEGMNSMTSFFEFSDVVKHDLGFYDPFEHFSQRSIRMSDLIHGRGCPLKYLRYENKVDPYICPFVENVFSPIQQYLQDGYPDLDSRFRTVNSWMKEGEYSFRKTSRSLSVEYGVFSPMNSQNTLFFREGFWGLLLPASVSHRVSDIWRGFISQRLLWSNGGRIVFHSPVSKRLKEVGDVMEDYVLEEKLFRLSDDLISFLRQWEVKSEWKRLDEAMKRLFVDLQEEGFLAMSDVELCNSWISDLKRIGYEFPSIIVEGIHSISLSGDHLASKSDFETLIENYKYIEEPKEGFCAGKKLQRVFRRVLLLLNHNKNFNITKQLEISNLVEQFYGVSFPHILLGIQKYNPKDEQLLSGRNIISGTRYGWASFNFLVNAMLKYPHFDGYFLVNDDSQLVPWRLNKMDLGNIYTVKSSSGGCVVKFGTWHYRFPELVERFKRGIEALQKTLNIKYDIDTTKFGYGCPVDIFYFPRGAKEGLMKILELTMDYLSMPSIGQEKVWLQKACKGSVTKDSWLSEIAIPLIAKTLSSKEFTGIGLNEPGIFNDACWLWDLGRSTENLQTLLNGGSIEFSFEGKKVRQRKNIVCNGKKFAATHGMKFSNQEVVDLFMNFYKDSATLFVRDKLPFNNE